MQTFINVSRETVSFRRTNEPDIESRAGAKRDILHEFRHSEALIKAR